MYNVWTPAYSPVFEVCKWCQYKSYLRSVTFDGVGCPMGVDIITGDTPMCLYGWLVFPHMRILHQVTSECINACKSPCKMLTIVVQHKQNWVVLINFSNNSLIYNLVKICLVVLNLLLMDRQTQWSWHLKFEMLNKWPLRKPKIRWKGQMS